MEKKTYQLVADDYTTTTFVRGRISGMIYVLTGQPEKDYGWTKAPGDVHWITRFIADAEQYKAVIDCVEKKYPNTILHVKEVER